VVLPLEPDQVKKKLDAIKRHKTQFSAAKVYLESYLRANELFDPIKDIPLAPGTEGVLLLPSGTGVAAGSALPEGASPDSAERRVRLEGNELVFSVTLDPASAADVETDPIGPSARCPRLPSPRRVRALRSRNGAKSCWETR
jgi:hypothetical protein